MDFLRKALTIAGSDCSGGAGIQADLKTFCANGIYGMSVITAVTSQNTMGVYDIHAIPPEIVASQLDAVFTDIFPESVKIGMVANEDIINVIADKLEQYKPINVVLDPVMVSTSGSKLFDESALEAFKAKLIPLADLITPNIPEAEILAQMNIKTLEDMEIAARKIGDQYNVAVMLKGGHLQNKSVDYFYCADGGTVLREKAVDNPNNHGTGCTLSSAIAAYLAEGIEMISAVKFAKGYVTEMLKEKTDLGKGCGPLMHIMIM